MEPLLLTSGLRQVETIPKELIVHFHNTGVEADNTIQGSLPPNVHYQWSNETEEAYTGNVVLGYSKTIYSGTKLTLTVRTTQAEGAFDPKAIDIRGHVVAVESLGRYLLSQVRIVSKSNFTVPKLLPRSLRRVRLNGDYFNDPNILEWDTSRLNDFSEMFKDCLRFDQPLNDWDVSGVTNFSSMFYGASVFNQPLDQWDVSQATTLSAMFRNAINFNQDLTKWDVERFATKPLNFDTGANAWQSDFKPLWGQPPKLG